MKSFIDKSFKLILLVVLIISCSDDKKVYKGLAFGTSFKIIYLNKTQEQIESKIDSIIKLMNLNFSLYDSQSLISKFNENQDSLIVDFHFKKVFAKAKEVWRISNGKFDPTIGILTKAWGFGSSDMLENIDSTTIDSLKKKIGFSNIDIKDGMVIKKIQGITLDFNALAKGYAIDVIADMFRENGIKNFLIEIGGEIVASGLNGKRKWVVGIEFPLENTKYGEIYTKINMKSEALATSGNYRKYYFDNDGNKIVHTISPETGYPVKNKLKAVSVLSRNCLTSDAYATAFMLMGLEESKNLLISNNELEGILIWENEFGEIEHFATETFKNKMIK